MKNKKRFIKEVIAIVFGVLVAQVIALLILNLIKWKI